MNSLKHILFATAFATQALAGPVLDKIIPQIPGYRGNYDDYQADKRLLVTVHDPWANSISSFRAPPTTYIRAHNFFMVDANSNEIFDGKDFIKLKIGTEEITYVPGDKTGAEIFNGMYNRLRIKFHMETQLYIDPDLEAVPQEKDSKDRKNNGASHTLQVTYLSADKRSSFLFLN